MQRNVLYRNLSVASMFSYTVCRGLCVCVDTNRCIDTNGFNFAEVHQKSKSCGDCRQRSGLTRDVEAAGELRGAGGSATGTCARTMPNYAPSMQRGQNQK